MKNRKKTRTEDRYCKLCKKKIYQSNRNKYCSKDCQITMNKKSIKSKYVKKFIPKYVNCKYCSESFKQKNYAHTTFCSKECSLLYYKKRYLEMKGSNLLISYLQLRFEILKRDNFTCQYCGRTPKVDKIKLHIDHIIPKSKGGKTIFSNLITSCSECNIGKSDVLLDENKIKLVSYTKNEN